MGPARDVDADMFQNTLDCDEAEAEAFMPMLYEVPVKNSALRGVCKSGEMRW